MLERHTGNDPITLTWKERILPIKLMPLKLCRESEIQTHGPFRACSFQDCCNKPDSATLPCLVHLEGLEPTRLTAIVSKTITATNYVTDANLKLWSKWLDSNQRPYASKANALPTALHLDFNLVDNPGFKPETLQCKCSVFSLY